LLASERELDPARRVWGAHDRSLPARDREALDWLTLCRFLGCEVRVEYGAPREELLDGVDCIVVARDPESLGPDDVAALEALVTSRPALVVVRAAAAGHPLEWLAGAVAEGRRSVDGAPRWVGPGPEREWRSRLAIEADVLRIDEGCVPWAFAGGAPLVVAREVGPGTIATLAAHPSEMRDSESSGSGLLCRLLRNAAPGTDLLDLEGSLVLRMDDPGSAANVHLEDWAHRQLSEREWDEVASVLRRRNARMSACYVPGWVDDGNQGRGELLVGGEAVERVAGRVHASPFVRYAGAGGVVNDYVAEAAGLLAPMEGDAGGVEQHGFTHVRPPYSEWLAAPDCYENVHWYREFEEFGGFDPTLVDLGTYAVPNSTRVADSAATADPISLGANVIQHRFGTRPTTLTFPGQAGSDAVTELALDAGFQIVATETLAIRHEERFCWSAHVTSPGLDYPDPHLLETGLPVVATFHDRDIVLGGVEWLERGLEQWGAAGARRFIDFRELARLLAG
jgi:hypothetical protein